MKQSNRHDLEDICRQLTLEFDHTDPKTRKKFPEIFATVRKHCPVFHSEKWGGFWNVSRLEDLQEIARNTNQFSSSPSTTIPPLENARPMLPIESDPPQHQVYRKLLLPKFSPDTTNRMEPLVRELAGRLIDSFVENHSVDLYEQYAKKLPMLLITQLLGIEEKEEFWEWTDTLVYGPYENRHEDVARALNEIYGYFKEVLSERRNNNDGEDLISCLATAEVEGRTYTDEEILDHAVFLLTAGLDNTAFAIRATLWHIATHEEHRQMLLEDPEMIRHSVEESLRMYSPVPALCRTARSNTELKGNKIRQGERVLMLFSSANRDESVFENPDTFIPERRANRHIAFGLGPHRCLGSNLARLEIRVAVELILLRIPAFRLQQGHDPGWQLPDPLLVEW